MATSQSGLEKKINAFYVRRFAWLIYWQDRARLAEDAINKNKKRKVYPRKEEKYIIISTSFFIIKVKLYFINAHYLISYISSLNEFS